MKQRALRPVKVTSPAARPHPTTKAGLTHTRAETGRLTSSRQLALQGVDVAKHPAIRDKTVLEREEGGAGPRYPSTRRLVTKQFAAVDPSEGHPAPAGSRNRKVP